MNFISFSLGVSTFLLSLSLLFVQPVNSEGFTRYPQRPAGFSDVEALLNNPVEINTRVESYREEGERKIRARSDYHAVFDIPLSKVVQILADHENEDSVYPRIEYSRDLSPETSLWEYHLQELQVSFRVLGIGAEYHYILNRLPRFIGERDFLISWYLHESLDGKMEHLEGSWFAMELTYQGRPHTYVRNYMDTIFANPPRGTTFALSLFGSRETKGFFQALYVAAKNVTRESLYLELREEEQ